MTQLKQRNRDRLHQANARFNERQMPLQTPLNTAFYSGYDGVTGKHLVRTLRGDRLQALSNSSGSLGLDDKVALNQARGVTPILDSMP